ncbi:MAG: B12-binding domain-containing radical SAM protein [Solirubrobacterales bacterium]
MADSMHKRRRLRIVVPAFPAFNIYSRIACRTTALGPVRVATTVNEMAGWDAEVIDENNMGRYGPRAESGGADHELIQRQRPADVVGFYGGLTSTIPRLYELARQYKRMGVTTIAGGQHFAGSNIQEALSSGIDYVVLGEGEEAIEELLRAIENDSTEVVKSASAIARIRGIAFLEAGRVVCTPEREPLVDFDKFPFPDFSLVHYAKIRVYPVERIRGCPMHCEFCTVKSTPRAASAERLFENIRYLVETHNASRFFIVDDLFGQQREDTIRLCEMLREYQETIGLQFSITVQIRLDKANDPDLLAAMRQAGIRHVAIGFESPIDEELKTMNKHINSEKMLSLVKVFRKHGFWVHGMFIFGYPAGPDMRLAMPIHERVKRFRQFIRKSGIDSVQVLLPVPLPGTELRRRLEEQGRIYPLEDVGWQYYDGNFPLFEPDPPTTAEELQCAGKRIMRRVYRFRYGILVAASILSFPVLVFSLHRLKAGWNRWYRRWEIRLIRFGGWITIRKWTSDFQRGDFLPRLQKARVRMNATRTGR